MNVYLEYKDESSAKFWKIEVQDLSHTVAYGKIGTEGQQKTKSFDTVEEAIASAEKLVKAKLKKGYQAVVSAATAPLKSRFLGKEEATEKFDLDQYQPLPDWNYDAVLLIEQDVVVEEGVYDSTISTVFFNGERETERELIIVQGDLIIKGDLAIYGETGFPSLLVLGDLHCKNLDSNDNFMYIAGDAYIKYLYYGNYNHGAIKVVGTTHVPYLINSDHHSDLNPCDSAILINVYNDNDDAFDYDYYRSDLIRVMAEGVLEIEEYDEEDEDFEEEDIEYDLDLGAFSKLIEQGKSPFKEGARTKAELLVDQLSALALENTIRSLDLSNNKLKKLPTVLFELTNLETLTIVENDLVTLPAAIGQLTNLKVLNLRKTRITELPAAIGQLKNLEVLNLTQSYELTSLPASIGELEKLEELNIAHCYKLKELPETLGQLNKLKKLVLLSFKGTVPDSLFELPQIEELEILT